MNTKALKAVLKFWAFVFSILGYAFLISYAETVWSGAWVVGMIVPMVVVFSFIVYLNETC